MSENSIGSFVENLTRVFRADGWQNVMTGLGTALRDKVKSTDFHTSTRIDEFTLETMYHEDDMVALLCDTLPEEMLRKGFAVNIEDEEGKDSDGKSRKQEEEVVTETERLEIISKFTDAMVWARLYGGAALFPILDDGTLREQLKEPLNEKAIRSIDSINVIEGRYMSPSSWYDDPAEKKYGLPKTYLISPYGAGGSSTSTVNEVHESRLILFDATRVTMSRRMQNRGFSDSIVQRAYDTMQMYATGWHSVGHLMSDASQGVFKIKNLIQMIATENDSTITKRMQLVDLCRSVARSIVVDADSESFERQSTSFAGLPETLQMFVLRLSSAFRMPATILMGQSPAGENATGDADFRWFYDKIESQQTIYLKPKLRRLMELVFLAKDGPTNGVVPTKWSIIFNPLQRMTEKETAELRSLQANTDAIYIDKGVLLPEEVTISRFTADGWSPDTKADLDLREKMLELESVNEISRAANPLIAPNGEPIDPGMSSGVGPDGQPITLGSEDPAAFSSAHNLNGAQITALVDLIGRIAAGEIPRATGIEIVTMGFPVDRATAEKIVGEAGQSFKPDTIPDDQQLAEPVIKVVEKPSGIEPVKTEQLVKP